MEAPLSLEITGVLNADDYSSLLRRRWMDPGTGRFMSLDSFFGKLNQPISLNKYLYADANPVMNADPTGMFSVSDNLTTLGITSLLSALILIMKNITGISGRYVISNAPSAPDVGPHLEAIRSHVINTYRKLPESAKTDLRNDFRFGGSLWNLGTSLPNLSTNWDIPALTAMGAKHQTVTVYGRVYPAEEVNYWLYGTWAQAIDSFEVNGLARVYGHRKWNESGTGIDGRQAWFLAGYRNNLNLPDLQQYSEVRSAMPNSAPWPDTMRFWLGTEPGRIYHDQGKPYDTW